MNKKKTIGLELKKSSGLDGFVAAAVYSNW